MNGFRLSAFSVQIVGAFAVLFALYDNDQENIAKQQQNKKKETNQQKQNI